MPAGAVISRFSMYVDGAELQAELLDAAKARKIYEDIVRTLRDPALLEYAGTDVFKVRIFPIEPHADKRVKISYREVLPLDAGTLEYVYPLNTEKFSARPLDLASVRVDVRTAEPLRTVYCPTHEVSVTRPSGNQAEVHWEARSVTPDTDFKLYLGTAAAPVGMTLLARREAGEDGFFFLTASPGLAAARPGRGAQGHRLRARHLGQHGRRKAGPGQAGAALLHRQPQPGRPLRDRALLHRGRGPLPRPGAGRRREPAEGPRLHRRPAGHRRHQHRGGPGAGAGPRRPPETAPGSSSS